MKKKSFKTGFHFSSVKKKLIAISHFAVTTKNDKAEFIASTGFRGSMKAKLIFYKITARASS